MKYLLHSCKSRINWENFDFVLTSSSNKSLATEKEADAKLTQAQTHTRRCGGALRHTAHSSTHSQRQECVCGALTMAFYRRPECLSTSWLGLLPHCKAIICHVMHETNAGTWLNDQMQLNQVMDLIKVLYEPLTALPAAPDPPLYRTKHCLLFIFWSFCSCGVKLSEQYEQNSKKLFDLMVFHKRASTVVHCMHLMPWLKWLEKLQS